MINFSHWVLLFVATIRRSVPGGIILQTQSNLELIITCLDSHHVHYLSLRNMGRPNQIGKFPFPLMGRPNQIGKFPISYLWVDLTK